MSKHILIRHVVSFTLIFIIFSENAMAINWNFIFSDKKYQSNIETSAYILNESQVPTVFSDPLEDLHQLPHNNLTHTSNYLLIRLKNKGNKGAWGSLIIKVNNEKYIDLQITFLRANMDRFTNYIIPLELILPKDDNLPKINIEWANLYSK